MNYQDNDELESGRSENDTEKLGSEDPNFQNHQNEDGLGLNQYGENRNVGGQIPTYNYDQNTQGQQQSTDYSRDTYNYNQPQNSGQHSQVPTDYRWDYNNYENYSREPQKRKNKGAIVFLIALIGFLVVGVVGISLVGILGANNSIVSGEDSAAIGEGEDGGTDSGKRVEMPTANPIPKDESGLPASGELLTIPQVAKKVTPSVVGILRYENTLYEATGLGSGFILHVDEDGYGYVVTNAHVVEYGTNFKVRLYDGLEYNADLVGADSISDIAVLKMKVDDPDELTPAEIGDSDQLEVGETVIAIGNPISFELSGSVTQGIVSALDRQLQVGSSINYIQTDAAINPGNSGGALVNQYGQVIGINTMKVQATGYEGIGFSIPMAEALPIVNELVENGKVSSRPILGITGAEVTESESRRLEIPMGILVYDISADAMFEPEIKVDDIITHANGERILSLADLKEQLKEFKVGDTMKVTVYRMINTVDSEEIELMVTLISSEEQ